MPLTANAKAIALDAVVRGVAPTASVTHVGLMRWSEAGKAVTGASATDIFTSTGHGYAAGDLVVFTATTGGAGIIVGDPYFVIATNLAANTFSVSKVPGGASIDTTTDLTAGTVRRLIELTGGSPAYARKAIAWAAASAVLEQIDDSTNGAVVDVPGGVTVDYISGHSALTAGTLIFIDDAPVAETFAAQGSYTVSDLKVNLTT